jgi:hypothetical protein
MGDNPETALSCLAFFLLLTPLTMPGFLLFVCLQGALILWQLPGVANHWIFTLFIDMAILTAAAVALGRGQFNKVKSFDFIDEFAPTVRILLLILYVFAVLHKLNTDFLNIGHSCAIAMISIQNATMWLGTHHPHIASIIDIFLNAPGCRIFFIACILIIESSIPILLMFSRTRVAGVLLGIGFHTVLSLDAHYAFSGMLFACYVLFLPRNVHMSHARMRVWHHSRIFYSRGWILASWGLSLLFVKLLSSVGRSHGLTLTAFMYGLVLLFEIYNKASHVTPYEYSARFLSPRQSAQFVVLALIILNGASPYLGFKTESSFAMFSNLRTEGGVSNHIFIPPFQLFNFQKEIIKIISSTDEKLQAYADQQYGLVPAHFKRLLQERYRHGRTDVRVIYAINEQVEEITSADDLQKLGAEGPFALRKVAWFRPVSLIPRCAH